MADHVADLGAVSGIVSGLCTARTPRTAPAQNGAATSKKPQTNQLQNRQFGGGQKPNMGSTSAPAYKGKHAATSVATDMVAT